MKEDNFEEALAQAYDDPTLGERTAFCNGWRAHANQSALKPDERIVLRDLAQALAWQSFGECRGYSERLLSPIDALAAARDVLGIPAAQATPLDDKSHPRFIAGYEAGMKDAKRSIAQQAAQPVAWHGGAAFPKLTQEQAAAAVNQSLTTAPQAQPSLMDVRHLWDAATEAAGGDGLEAMQHFAGLVLSRYGAASHEFDAADMQAQWNAGFAAGSAAPRPTDDEMWDQALRERDSYHDMADQLAAQIAAITGEEIGEHSSANDPWRNAMLAADEFIAAPIRKLCSAPAVQTAPLAEEDARPTGTLVGLGGGWIINPDAAQAAPLAAPTRPHQTTAHPIKEPYTLAEIEARIASHDYSAELLLQHAMELLRGRAGEDAQPVPAFYVRDADVARLADRRLAGIGAMLNKESGPGMTAYYATPQPAAQAAPAVPLLTKEHQGMRVDYSGLLQQAANALVLGGKAPGLAEMLRQLQGHMTELGLRWYASDTAVVDELCQLYCVGRDARVALTTQGASHD